MSYPIDYVGELSRRQKLYKQLSEDNQLREGAREFYAANLIDYVNDNVWLVEPRNANKGIPVKMPAVTFPRQGEYLLWLKANYELQKSGPVEKSRDSGATWMACVFATWLWLFHSGSAVGFGSRKETLVDKKGSLQSIFEKIRSVIQNLPPYLMPAGFNWDRHSKYMQLDNPENGASTIGEAGDNIGRGGRTSIYFVDEAAFIERPELVEAALTANTDVRVDISSPRVGSLFNENVRTSDNVFVFDVRDVPWHTDEWIAGKQAELEAKGLGHIFAQEYLRDGTAGIEGQLISSDLIDAAIGAFERLGISPTGEKVAGLDVADGGSDPNALTIRHGGEVTECKSLGHQDAGGAGITAHSQAKSAGCQKLIYDSIGVGAGVASATKPLKGVKVIGWAASEAPHQPKGHYVKGRPNEDMFRNAKAQAWWLVRDRFLETKKALDGLPYDPEKIISINPNCTDIRDLKTELAQIRYEHNSNGKIIIIKTPAGHRSPNLAESFVISFAPRCIGGSTTKKEAAVRRSRYRPRQSSNNNWKTT